MAFHSNTNFLLFDCCNKAIPRAFISRSQLSRLQSYFDYSRCLDTKAVWHGQNCYAVYLCLYLCVYVYVYNNMIRMDVSYQICTYSLLLPNGWPTAKPAKPNKYQHG